MRGETSRPYGPLRGQTIRVPGGTAAPRARRFHSGARRRTWAVVPVSPGGADLSRRLSAFLIYLFNLIYLIEEKTFSRAVGTDTQFKRAQK